MVYGEGHDVRAPQLGNLFIALLPTNMPCASRHHFALWQSTFQNQRVITMASFGLQAVANGDVDLVGQAWQQVHTGDVHPDIDTLNALLK